MEKFKLKQYKTIEELECFNWKNEITTTELQEMEFEAVDIDGNEKLISWQEKKKAYDEMGYWGFIDDTSTIHFWIKKDCAITFEELLFFFGHELGHFMKGGTAPTQEDYNDNSEIHFKEEDRADEYGFVAVQAYKFASQVINNNK